MNSGSRIALAAVGGYFVGRSRKLRRTALLGGAIWSGKALASGDNGLVGRATEALGSVSELKDFKDVRGRLVDAGKVAVTTAASNKVNSFSDSLHEKAESLRGDVEKSTTADESQGDDEPAREREPEKTKPATQAKSTSERQSSREEKRPGKGGKSSEGSGSSKRTSGGGDHATGSQKKTASGRSSKSRSSSGARS